MKKKMYCVALSVLACGSLAFVAMAGEDAARKDEQRKLPSVLPAEQDNEAAWDAWREEFHRLLDADEAYKAAVAAVETYYGDDKAEYEALVAVRDDSYRAVALALYEDYFGAWTGTLGEFDNLIAVMAVNPNIKACRENAVAACGAGKVCSVTVSGEDCSLTCQDGQGNCPTSEPG